MDKFMLAANYFPRKAQYPYGQRAVLAARIHRMETKLGRTHRPQVVAHG